MNRLRVMNTWIPIYHVANWDMCILIRSVRFVFLSIGYLVMTVLGLYIIYLAGALHFSRHCPAHALGPFKEFLDRKAFKMFKVFRDNPALEVFAIPAIMFFMGAFLLNVAVGFFGGYWKIFLIVCWPKTAHLEISALNWFLWAS